MSMFPNTVTLYNVVKETDLSTLEETPTNYITILRGVLLDASKGTNVRSSGLEGADAVNLYIPFSVEAVDGVTGEPKQYITPVEFWRIDDKTGLWTLKAGLDTFFIKGEVVEPDKTLEYIESAYDDVYNITKVDEKDFGSDDMQHWEVGGN